MPLAELLLYQQAALFFDGRHWLTPPTPPVHDQWNTLFDSWQKKALP